MAGAVDHAVLILEDARFDANRSQQQLPSELRIYRSSNQHHHQHFVLGVAYDPSNTYLASMSSNRTVRILSRRLPPKSKKKVLRHTTAVPRNRASTAQLLTESKLELASKAKPIKFRRVVAHNGGAAVNRGPCQAICQLSLVPKHKLPVGNLLMPVQS